jgi:hypothetical protein
MELSEEEQARHVPRLREALRIIAKRALNEKRQKEIEPLIERLSLGEAGLLLMFLQAVDKDAWQAGRGRKQSAFQLGWDDVCR